MNKVIANRLMLLASLVNSDMQYSKDVVSCEVQLYTKPNYKKTAEKCISFKGYLELPNNEKVYFFVTTTNDHRLMVQVDRNMVADREIVSNNMVTLQEGEKIIITKDGDIRVSRSKTYYLPMIEDYSINTVQIVARDIQKLVLKGTTECNL